MDNQEALNNDQVTTNTGDVHNTEPAETGLTIPSEPTAEPDVPTPPTLTIVDANGAVQDAHIPYIEEKLAVANFFGAESLVFDGPFEHDELDQLVTMKNANDEVVSLPNNQPHTLRQLYQVVLDNKPTGSIAPNEQSGIAPLTEGQQAWINRNPRFNDDLNFQAETIGAHEAAIQKGYVVDTDEYFSFIDARLKLLFPETETKEQSFAGVSGPDEANLLSQPGPSKGLVAEPDNA